MDTINRNEHQERATSQVLESEKGGSGPTLKIGLLLIISFAIAMPGEASLYPGADDLDALLDGVAEIAAPGVPSSFSVYGPESFPVIVGAPRNAADAVRAPVVSAGRWQAGRVVALGHKGYFNSSTLEKADTARLMANAFAWVSGGGASASPRIGVVGNAQLRTWLIRTGHDVVEAALTSESLGAVDVVAVDMGNQSAPELEALSAFVRAGGGLVTAANGWGWASLHPKLDIINDFAGNRLLAPIGIQWLNSSLKRTSPAGYAVAEPPSELTHAGKAFNAVEAHIAGRRKLTQPEVDQTLHTLARTIRALPPNDVLFAPDMQVFFSNYEGTRWPSAKHPVDKSDVVARMVATLFVSEHHRTPPQSVRAHPAAADFPGTVPTDAPRLTLSLIIDTTVPRWHSTGLYAAPGDLVTVTVPTRVANSGFFVRIGAHSDQIWRRPTWKRMPKISYRFPISASRTRVANAFGGLIYIEVPKKNPGFGRITVEVEGAVAAPLFVLGETDPAVWRAEIRHAPAPWAEIAGRNMIVTTPSSEVRGLDDPTAVAETWDRVLDLAAELAAWPPNTRSSPERFVVDRQISAGYLHSGYPLMGHLAHQSKLVDAEHIRSEGNWGFFHEVGHNHQHKDWTFTGTTEVTVNLFSLYIYEFLCGIPAVDGEFPGRKRLWAALMASYDFDNPTFEHWKKNPFLALIMYAQMQQAFGWDAYRQVFATYRALPNDERPKNDDEKRDQWLVRFSRTVGRNLGPFFEAWGIPTSKAARNSIADLPVWMPPNFPP